MFSNSVNFRSGFFPIAAIVVAFQNERNIEERQRDPHTQ